MDGIAKFVGYVVLVLVAIGLFNTYSGKQEAQEAAGVSTAPVRDRCKELATTQLVHSLALELLKKTNDFGTNVESNLEACRYFPAEDTLLVNVVVGWNGPFSGDYYEKAGRLTVSGQGWQWEETRANEALRAYRLALGVAGILVAAATDGASDASGPASASFKVRNECDHPIQVAIRYADMAGTWRTAGWWPLGVKGESVLADGQSVPITTGSANWYYYAESTDGSAIVWAGEHKVVLDGRELPMTLLTDKEGDSEWALQCPAARP